MLSPYPPCWILTTRRTGSTWLGRLLVATGYFESCCFVEYYSHQKFQPHYRDHPPPAAKVHAHQFCEHYTENFPIETLLPGVQFIYLYRRNLVAKAVSKFFARKTGVCNLYTARDVQEYSKRLLTHDDVVLLECYQDCLREHAAWDSFLATREYHTVCFEDLQ